MLKSTVLSLGVLPDGHQIHVFVGSIDALNAPAGTHVGEQLQPLAQSHVEGAEALADGGFEGALQPVLVALDSRDGVVGDEVALLGLSLGVDGVVLELDGDLEGGEDVLDASGDLGTDAVSGEEDHLLLLGAEEEGVAAEPAEREHDC